MEPINTVDKNREASVDNRTPIGITVICLLLLISVVSIAFMFWNQLKNQNEIEIWYPPYLILSAGILLTCMVGFWKMKKWAAYTYIAYAVLNQIFLLVLGTWTFMALIVPAVVVWIALAHVKKMD